MKGASTACLCLCHALAVVTARLVNTRHSSLVLDYSEWAVSGVLWCRPTPTTWWTTTSSWTCCLIWPKLTSAATCRPTYPTCKPPSCSAWACSRTTFPRLRPPSSCLPTRLWRSSTRYAQPGIRLSVRCHWQAGPLAVRSSAGDCNHNDDRCPAQRATALHTDMSCLEVGSQLQRNQDLTLLNLVQGR